MSVGLSLCQLEKASNTADPAVLDIIDVVFDDGVVISSVAS